MTLEGFDDEPQAGVPRSEAANVTHGLHLAWAAWVSAPVPLRDAEAEGILADYLADLEIQPTRERLERILTGDNWAELFRRVVKAEDAIGIARAETQPGLSVHTEQLSPWAGQERRRIVVTKRRPSLAELCHANRLNRRQLVGRLESACRRVHGFASLNQAREFIAPMLMGADDVRDAVSEVRQDQHVLLWKQLAETKGTADGWQQFCWREDRLAFERYGLPAPIGKLAADAVKGAIADRRDVSIVRTAESPFRTGSADMMMAIDRTRPVLIVAPGERREVNPRWVMAFATCTKAHPEIFAEDAVQDAVDAFVRAKYLDAPPGTTPPNLLLRCKTVVEDFVKRAAI